MPQTRRMSLRPAARPSGPRRHHLATSTTLVLLGLCLAGCTARMDMTLSASGTYDVTLEMRDTTGTVLTADTGCAAFADPSLVGSPAAGGVTTERIGSADDAAGPGCRVTIRGVKVSDSSESRDASPLVVREGDLYTVDLTGLAGAFGSGPGYGVGTAEPEGPSAVETAAPERADGPGATPDAAPGTTPEAAGAAADSLAEVVDSRVSITFPGAVVEAGGGTVHGSTVTWDDTDTLAGGVRATGYATADEGLSWWDRHATALIAGLLATGAVTGVLAAIRWRRAHRRQARS